MVPSSSTGVWDKKSEYGYSMEPLSILQNKRKNKTILSQMSSLCLQVLRAPPELRAHMPTPYVQATEVMLRLKAQCADESTVAKSNSLSIGKQRAQITVKSLIIISSIPG